MSVAPVAETTPRETAPRAYVEGVLNHIAPMDGKPAIHIPPEGTGHPRRTYEHEQHTVKIHDMRDVADGLSLDVEGLALVHHDTKVKDFLDPDEVRAVYYPEVAELVKQATGASDVVVFDHTVRIGQKAGEYQAGPRKPVRIVHNDYTPKSGPQRVRDLLPADEAEDWLSGRYAIINVWRPIKGPVVSMPLAVADARFMGPEDFVAADMIYEDRIGEIYEVAHNPEHRWYYVPGMQRNEAMLLKCYDSETDGRARFTAHSAFVDPTTPDDAPPRESIEIRTLVRFD